MDYVGSMRMDIAFGTGFLVETGLYSLPQMTSARRLKNPHSSKPGWVFLTFSILMYVVASLHIILSAFRFYKSIFLSGGQYGAIAYLKSHHHWEFFWLIVLYCVQTWLGDALMIYRCYIVWESSLLSISVPLCLLFASIGVNAVIWNLVYHPLSLAPKQGYRFFGWIYPLAFVQNVITTGLIILKIFSQHYASKKAGVVHVGSGLSLLRVVRVVIESAAIYTIQLLILIVLYFCGGNGQYVVQAAITPSIGITFILLSIRVQPSVNRNARASADLDLSSIIVKPGWQRDAESVIDSEISEDDSRNHQPEIEFVDSE